MIIFKEDVKDKTKLFNESVDEAKFIAVDCEMTGVVKDINTDGTKYDTPQIRYHKQREIAKTFGLIQVGITCYIEAKKDDIEFYIERTFTFYLFKNSRFGWLCLQHPMNSKFNLFNSLLHSHPLALKFLSDNGFDFNILFLKGLHFNKLGYRERIAELLKNHVVNGNYPNNIIHLNKKAEEQVLIFGRDLARIIRSDEPKKVFNYDKINQDFIINYILGVNWKKIINVSGFGVRRDKNNPLLLIVEKSKSKLDLKGFVDKWKTVDDFIALFTFKDVLDAKFANFASDKEKNFDVARAVEEELGFSLFIEKLIQCKKPIIGHNPILDLLFIYQNCIDDLPESYEEFKNNIHSLFPMIIDTRYLVTRYEYIFDKRGIENITKKIKDKKFDEYIQVVQDLKNGFGFYCGNQDKNHDAGYDSYVTGRIFISVLKAIENNFETSNRNQIAIQANNHVIEEGKEIKIKKGFVDLNILVKNSFLNKVNFSIVAEVESLLHQDICFNFNVDLMHKKEHSQCENIHFKNVFLVLFKSNKHIYEVAQLFNGDWHINIVMANSDASFVEFMTEEVLELELVKKVYMSESISDIYTYEEYSKNYRKFLKF